MRRDDQQQREHSGDLFPVFPSVTISLDVSDDGPNRSIAESGEVETRSSALSREDSGNNHPTSSRETICRAVAVRPVTTVTSTALGARPGAISKRNRFR